MTNTMALSCNFVARHAIWQGIGQDFCRKVIFLDKIPIIRLWRSSTPKPLDYA